MTLTEQANLYSKTSYFNRTVRQSAPLVTPTNRDQPQILSVHVYSAQRLFPLAKPVKQDRPGNLHLPPIERQKIKRPPLHRPAVQHLHSSQVTPTDLSQLTGRGLITDSSALLKEMDRANADEYHHVPPPSPSDDQIECLLHELQRRRPSTPRIPVSKDGYVPYRLPTLHPSMRSRQAAFPPPPTQMKSTLSTYRQTLIWKHWLFVFLLLHVPISRHFVRDQHRFLVDRWSIHYADVLKNANQRKSSHSSLQWRPNS